MTKLDVKPIVAVLNRLLEAELAGVVRYTHYSFLVFGFGRIPIVSWLRAQADESLLHAQQVGEWITTLGRSWTRISMTLPRRCANRWRPRARRSTSIANCCDWSKASSSVGGIRATDDSGGGGARRGSGQDAAQAGRGGVVCAPCGPTAKYRSGVTTRV